MSNKNKFNELEELFKFEPSETKSNCYNVLKYFGTRAGIRRYLPVAEIKVIDGMPDVHFITKTLTSKERVYIASKSKSLF